MSFVDILFVFVKIFIVGGVVGVVVKIVVVFLERIKILL